jgi:hypothetical protein
MIIIVLISMIVMTVVMMICMITMVIIMQLTVVMQRLIVLHRWGQLWASGWPWLLRLPNRSAAAPAVSTSISRPVATCIRSFRANSSVAVGGVDGVAAPIAVAALGDIRDDQFVIDPAPEWPTLGLSFLNSALACHHAGARRAWAISRRGSLNDRNRCAPA